MVCMEERQDSALRIRGPGASLRLPSSDLPAFSSSLQKLGEVSSNHFLLPWACNKLIEVLTQAAPFARTRFSTPHLPPRSSLRPHVETMPFFKITLIRSSIGLPKKTQGVLNALGLRKRMATVFKPVNPSTAGQIMKIKELVAVSEVEAAMTDAEMREMRRPDPGYYIETPAAG